MSCSGSCTGVSGVKLRMSLPSGWRGCCGLAMGLVSSRKVSSLPGASGAARSACRARESSPKRVSWVARLALWSGVGWLEAGGGGCARWLGAVLAARRSRQAPSKNLVKRSSNWFWNSGRVGRAVEQHPGEEQPKFPSPFMVETVVDGG